MRIYHVIVAAVVLGTALPIGLHYAVHGVVSPHQVGIAFFLWLNTIVALWEICLFLRIDLIEAQYAGFRTEYAGRELDRPKDFFAARIPVSKVLSPSTWAELWSSYALFDPSYADRRSFGFYIDIGNGFSTLVPSLLFTYGMTFHVLSPRVLGVIGLLICYQMWYGTVVYFTSYVLNKRYVGHSPISVALFVGLSNGMWFTFPIWAMWAALRMIDEGSYAVFMD
ncbi:MAG TPA: hypothetical protein VGB85_28575 [Nannocystis sp.]|jgi:hypothetical protein